LHDDKKRHIHIQILIEGNEMEENLIKITIFILKRYEQAPIPSDHLHFRNARLNDGGKYPEGLVYGQLSVNFTH
jgi:hypothetical protein